MATKQHILPACTLLLFLILRGNVAHAAPESMCTTVTRAGQVGFGHVTLTLKEMQWSGWQDLCGDLTRYMNLGAPPFAPEQTTVAQNLLLETGYFRGAQCGLQEESTHLTCVVRPRGIVYDVEVKGSIPFALLEADVRRRLFLRPGVLLGPVQRDLVKQQRRIEDYLTSEGYFNSKAEIRLLPVEDAQPNQGVLVEAHVSAGQSAKLREVDLLGDPVLSKEEATRALKHFWLFYAAQSRFRPAAFEEDVEGLEALVRRRGYPEARVSGEYHYNEQAKAVDVVLTVDAGPQLGLRFGGQKIFSAEELAKHTTFSEAGVIDIVEVDNSKDAIVETYQRKGHYAAKIEASLSGERPAKLWVTFSIQEGASAELVDITMRGNQTFKQKRVEQAADLVSRASGLFTTGRWVNRYVERDVSAIAEFYRTQGFSQAKVEWQREFVEGNNLRLVFVIEEGPRRTVQHANIVGLPQEVDTAALAAELHVKDDVPFVAEQVDEDRRGILTQLAAMGFAKAEVVAKVEPEDVASGPVDVQFSVTPGQRSRFGGVLVRGNFRTHDGLIEQEIGLDANAPLNVEALGRARTRLRDLGIFSSADLKALGTYREGPTWFLAALEERDQRTVDAVLSFATDELFSVGADYQDRNLFGRALRLNLELRWSNASEFLTPVRIGNLDRLRLLMSAPRPFGFPLNAEGNALYQYEDQQLFRERIAGASVSLWRIFVTRNACSYCPDLIASFTYELVSTEYDTKGPNAQPADTVAPDGTLRNGTIGRVFPKVSLDWRDSYVDPQRGYYTELRFEFANHLLAANLDDASNFLRLITAAQFYVPLVRPKVSVAKEGSNWGGPLILALGATFGAAKPTSSTHGIPLSETFYYGGDTSVRGLTNRASQTINPAALYLTTATLELRWYFLQNLGFGSFQGAAFVDTGTVANTFGTLFDQTTVSVGPVLRYVTPVGPLSLAYGFPIVLPLGLATDGRLHFSFGYTF